MYLLDRFAWFKRAFSALFANEGHLRILIEFCLVRYRLTTRASNSLVCVGFVGRLYSNIFTYRVLRLLLFEQRSLVLLLYFMHSQLFWSRIQFSQLPSEVVDIFNRFKSETQ